ncbi:MULTISPECIES: hypothetical protein [Arenibacter]|uniref:hypothetical protein n=1 Tax=Arenibacter TaxID=178469 RepID=UPI0013001421|nr:MULTISPECIES: hypothetical protein [Arenibacter]
MNKILEIIEKTKKTDSTSRWLEGYPESQWKLLCSLENGCFLENEEEIAFFTTDNQKIGLTKNFITERTREKAVYGSMGTVTIEKNLIEKDIFKITDRVGNYLKIRVEPMFNSGDLNEQVYYTQTFTKKQLALISDGFVNNWFIPRHSIGKSYIRSLSSNEYKLYFESIGLLQSKLGGYKFSGVIANGGQYHNWLEIMDLLKTTKEEKGLSMDFIENLEEYNHHNYI